MAGKVEQKIIRALMEASPPKKYRALSEKIGVSESYIKQIATKYGEWIYIEVKRKKICTGWKPNEKAMPVLKATFVDEQEIVRLSHIYAQTLNEGGSARKFMKKYQVNSYNYKRVIDNVFRKFSRRPTSVSDSLFPDETLAEINALAITGKSLREISEMKGIHQQRMYRHLDSKFVVRE